MGKQKKVTVASVVRRLFALKKQLSDEQFIETVNRETNTRHFGVHHLSWYKSRHKMGMLSKGRQAAKSN